MKTLTASVLVTIALLLASCTWIYSQMISEKMVQDISSIERFQGTLKQTWATRKGKPIDVVTKVMYRNPWNFRSEVVSPADMKGDLFIYDGNTLTMWSPRSLLGIRITGASTPELAQMKRAIESNTLWSLKHYAFSFLGQNRIAERPVNHWRAIPKVKLPFVYPYESWMDTTYSVPLRLEIQDAPNRDWFSMVYDNLSFETAVPENAFRFDFPPNAVVFEWDLRDPGVAMEEIRKTMNFDMYVPSELPRGHKVRKIIRGKGSLPMVLMLMDSDVLRLSLIQMRAMPSINDNEPGLPVSISGVPGQVIFYYNFTTINWIKGNTYLSLSGNLPYPDLIRIAEKVK